MKLGILTVIGAAMLLSSAPVRAADPDNGRSMAERWCVHCHVIAPQTAKRTVADGVPTFMEIARNPKKTPDRLRNFLTDPHPPMPDFYLSRQEMDDLIAYIQTLR
ncbi:MAG: c-type cytochrome [Alphaproteobacteria bacterium]|nr:c-type cytochrome [Alphaproteobacteria bacterium]